MKSSRFRESFRKSASKGHILVGTLLRQIFPYSKIYQEYPVNKILPSFRSGRHKYDWVVLDKLLVIEVMGEQHYKAVRWSSRMSDDDAELALMERRRTDMEKREAALEAGFHYLEIPYSDLESLTRDGLFSRIYATIMGEE